MGTLTEKTDRILSIDVFRGLTMLLLIGEFTHLYHFMIDDSLDGTLIFMLGQQLHHHPWHGLHFWDLIQPFFMFIVGLSLPFAVENRLKKGQPYSQISRHVLKRSIVLLIMGWALYCIGPGKITFQFQNVLAQIAFTYMIAYLIMDRSFRFQILFSAGLLLLTEILYRGFSVEGFNQHFEYMKNFGTWLDMQYGGDSGDGWAAINIIPTAAHTIWGVLAGKVLMRDLSEKQKLMRLLIAGIVLIVFGYLLDPITPMIKRIATSSFVIVSGGWAILFIAFFYWLIDVRKIRGGWILIFSVVSMNSLFIYLFAHLDGAVFVERIFHPFVYLFFSKDAELAAQMVTRVLVWFSLWGLCFWMYKRKLFVTI